MNSNNNSDNSNNNYNNNNNELNNKLYNSVFNNKYLKNIIFNHLNKFNILYNNIQFRSIEQWDLFKHKEYLNKVTFYFEFDLNQLPPNIQQVQVSWLPTNIVDNIKSVPKHIDSVQVLTNLNNNHLNLLSNYSSKDSPIPELQILKEVYLNIDQNYDSKYLTVILKLKKDKDKSSNSINIIPQITSISVYGDFQLKKDLLPNTLKTLRINSTESFEDGCFPESLKFVNITCSNTLIVNQFPLNGLLELELGASHQIIGSNIRFPNTLQTLSIYCSKFNAKLPDSLKSLVLELESYDYKIQFPSSLESLEVYFDTNESNIELFQNKLSVPPNLKELTMISSSIVDNNGDSILPDKLEKLALSSFNQILQANQLPSSLAYLYIGFSQPSNQVIDVNVLPSNLKELRLGNDYNQPINPLAIPQQLKHLIIYNEYYEHSINLPVSTHPNTLISIRDISLYYNSSNTSVRSLMLPINFDSPLSTLQLQDKSSLQHLHLGFRFDQPIQLTDLPINNSIKTLELSYRFEQTINLELFQNLETIILQKYLDINNTKLFNLITTTINQQDGSYNYYNLKNIILPKDMNNDDYQILKYIDINFYQFIKTNK